MVSAIQTVPSVYTVNQLANLGTVSQQVLRVQALLAEPSAIVNLGAITSNALTYNASGQIDIPASLAAIGSNSASASSIYQASLQSSSSDAATFIASAMAATEANSATALDTLLQPNIDQSTSSEVASIAKDSGGTIPVPATQPQASPTEAVTSTSTTPSATEIAAPVSSATTATATANTSAPPVIASMPASNSIVDSSTQAISTVAENPAYANMVAGLYVSVANASTPSTSLTMANQIDVIQPVSAVSPIGQLSEYISQFWREMRSSWPV